MGPEIFLFSSIFRESVELFNTKIDHLYNQLRQKTGEGWYLFDSAGAFFDRVEFFLCIGYMFGC